RAAFLLVLSIFFFNAAATTDISPLSLHDALPILGQPRTNVGSFTDYFDALVGWEPFRASQFGIAHHCTIALNPKEANDPRCAPVDRKSTRLNSSHSQISYAVFCLKKKIITNKTPR